MIDQSHTDLTAEEEKAKRTLSVMYEFNTTTGWLVKFAKKHCNDSISWQDINSLEEATGSLIQAVDILQNALSEIAKEKFFQERNKNKALKLMIAKAR